MGQDAGAPARIGAAVHGRRLQRQPRARVDGLSSSSTRPPARPSNLPAPSRDHQQPHGADRRHRGAVDPQAAVPGRAGHRQPVRRQGNQPSGCPTGSARAGSGRRADDSSRSRTSTSGRRSTRCWQSTRFGSLTCWGIKGTPRTRRATAWPSTRTNNSWRNGNRGAMTDPGRVGSPVESTGPASLIRCIAIEAHLADYRRRSGLAISSCTAARASRARIMSGLSAVLAPGKLNMEAATIWLRHFGSVDQRHSSQRAAPYL